MANTRTIARQIESEISKLIVGKERQLRHMLAAIFAEGHILLDDLPGVGKTSLVKAMAKALGCQFKRIQFTPDLLPSDVVGMNIFDRNTGTFKRMEGPVMTNLLLADEINRAIPRTQSALLEAMEERQVTLDGESAPLPVPFVVMATQNPVELESTFHLPAAQLDRFMVCLSLGYPEAEQETALLRQVGDVVSFEAIEAVTCAQELAELQRELRGIAISDPVLEYLVALVRATRSHSLIRLGGSPRAARALYKAAKALAAMSGRTFVTPDDVQELAGPVLCHRLVLSSEARMAGKSAASLMEELIAALPVPPAREQLFVHGP